MIKNLQPTLAEAGKIKIGGLGAQRTSQRGGTYRLPEKHDHFTVTSTQRDEAGDLIVDEDLMQALREARFADRDGKIRRLPIILHSDEIDEVFPTAYVAYSGKRMFCRGDGETAERREIVNGQWTGAVKQRECPCEYLQEDAKGERRCKPNGTLHCSIALPGRAVAGAVHRWRTTSLTSIKQLIGSFEMIRERAVGTICGIPLELVVRPIVVNPPGKPASTVHVCHVVLHSEDIAAVQRQAIAAMQARRELAAAMGRDGAAEQYRAMLCAPGQDDDEDPTIAAEYYPDGVVGQTPAGVDVVQAAPATPDPLADLWTPPQDSRPHEPPAKPATPPVASQPEQSKGRTRRTKCSGCGVLYGPGVVVKGLCENCRSPGPPADLDKRSAPDLYDPKTPGELFKGLPDPDPAPEIGPGPAAPPPYDRIKTMMRATVQRGVPKTAITAVMGATWPDWQQREPGDWTDDEAVQAELLLGGLGQ